MRKSSLWGNTQPPQKQKINIQENKQIQSATQLNTRSNATNLYVITAVELPFTKVNGFLLH